MSCGPAELSAEMAMSEKMRVANDLEWAKTGIRLKFACWIYR